MTWRTEPILFPAELGLELLSRGGIGPRIGIETVPELIPQEVCGLDSRGQARMFQAGKQQGRLALRQFAQQLLSDGGVIELAQYILQRRQRKFSGEK